MKTRYFLFILLFCANQIAQSQTKENRVTNLKTSWIGNSFGGGDKWVQINIWKMKVSPDGTINTLCGWDEAHREYGVYKGKQNPDGSWYGDVIGNKKVTITPQKATVNGTKWYIEGFVDSESDYDEGRVKMAGTRIIKEGTNIVISDVEKATSLGVDLKNNLLMVTDDGKTRHTVRFYDNNGKFVKQIGIPGGIWPSSIGGDPKMDGVIDSEFKFWDLSGCGTDSTGRIYISTSDIWSQSGSQIMCFNPEGDSLLWELHSYSFTEFGDVDRTTDGNVVFGVNERYEMDYKKQPGKQYKRVAHTLNPYKYPDDFRKSVFGMVPMIRHIDDKKFMFASAMYSGLWYYKFNQETDGEIAIPVKKLWNGGNESFFLDKNGDYYIVKWYDGIIKYPEEGLDAKGELVYGSEVKFPMPKEFDRILRCYYLGGPEDEMIVGGFYPDDDDNVGWWHVGKHMVKYKNWNTNPTVVWSQDLYYYHHDISVFDRRVNISIQVIGDYVMVDYVNYNSNKYNVDAPGVINVYKLSDGKFVGEIFSGPETFWQSSWHDLPVSFQGMVRSNGEYLILGEENWKAKMLVYNWCPTGECFDTDIKVSLNSPVENKYYYSDSTLKIDALVSSDTMKIDSVLFFMDNVKLGVTENTPYETSVEKLTSGAHSVWVKVYAEGVSKTTRKYSFLAGNGMPEVMMLPPKSKYLITDSLVFDVKAKDYDGTVSRVNIFLNGDSVATDNEFPFSFVYKNLTEGTYNLKAQVVDNDGKSVFSSEYTSQVYGYLPAINPEKVVNGVLFDYYEGDNQRLPAFDLFKPVKQGITSNFSLSKRKVSDRFSFRFKGFIEVPSDGSYTFYTSSDDGSKLYIDSFEVVNNDGLHGTLEASGNILLKAGKHNIEVAFFESGGGEVLETSWSGPGIEKAIIPSNVLYCEIPDSYTPASISFSSPQNNDSVPLTGKIVVTPVLKNFGFDALSTIDVIVDGQLVKNYTAEPAKFEIANKPAGTYKLTAIYTDYFGNQSKSDTVTFKFYDKSTGISDEQILTGTLNIYPNPAKDKVDINIPDREITNGEIIVYDLTSRVVLKQFTEENTTTIDVSGWNTGTYFICALFENGKLFRGKFVKF